jgi:hypothetical protein
MTRTPRSERWMARRRQRRQQLAVTGTMAELQIIHDRRVSERQVAVTRREGSPGW